MRTWAHTSPPHPTAAAKGGVYYRKPGSREPDGHLAEQATFVAYAARPPLPIELVRTSMRRAARPVSCRRPWLLRRMPEGANGTAAARAALATSCGQRQVGVALGKQCLHPRWRQRQQSALTTL